MLKSVQFKNYKALEDTKLPLGRFTLLVGPNGSGKTTALTAIATARKDRGGFKDVVTASQRDSPDAEVVVQLNCADPHEGAFWRTIWKQDGVQVGGSATEPSGLSQECLAAQLDRVRVFSLQANSIAAPVALDSQKELNGQGAGLAIVLELLRNREPERYDDLNRELGEWLPEFDRIELDDPSKEDRSFSLRTRDSGHKISATDLSHGTLFALVLLTLSYLPDPPSIVCLEDPDQGIHPRLLRRVQDAIYRLAYPENFDDQRDPVQVIATTHSPYFLDLFKDHPEEVVIAEKTQHGVQFQRLSELPNVSEILADAPLGEVWYTGILGGVPTGS